VKGLAGLGYRFLRRVTDVRPDESRPAFWLFFYFFLITFAAYVIKPVKVSLYLAWMTADRLPYAYLMTAALMGLAVSLNAKLLARLNRLAYLSASLLFFISNLLLFWWLFRFHWAGFSMVFWFWSDLFIVSSVMQFWMMVNDIYNPRQARRLVAFLVSGGLLGGVAGALLTTLLAKVIGTENLLLVCPLLLALGLLVLRRLGAFRREEAEARTEASDTGARPKVGYAESFRIVRRNRYLLLLSGLMAAGIVVTTLVDFQFNKIVEFAFPHKNARTSFLGTFFLGLLVFSTLLNLLLANRILKHFGLLTALLVAPAVMILGAGAIFFVPVASLLFWAVPVKGVDKSLSHTLNQSVRELLYIPVPADIKYKAKVFIDMFVNKFADAVAAILLLVLPLTVRGVSLLAAAFALGWAALAVLITREYASVVRNHLKIKWEDADRLVLEQIDVDLTKLVFDTLESRNRSSVLYAMNLYDLIHRQQLTPELRRIIAQRSGELRAGALDSLLGVDGETLFPELEDSLPEEALDAEVQKIMNLSIYRETIGQYFEKVMAGRSRESEMARLEAAKALGLMGPDSPLGRNLVRLLRDESTEVASYALDSAGRLKRRDLLPYVLAGLARPAVAQAASRALVEYGEKIAGALKDYLADPEEDLWLRRAIPDILARIGTQRAADILQREFGRDRPDLEAELIEAMAKIKSGHPDLIFSDSIIDSGVLRFLKRSYKGLQELTELSPGQVKDDLARGLESSLSRFLKSIFALLGLIYPAEDIRKAYQNLLAGTKKAIDYSIELLDSLLDKDIKSYLLPLVDDVPLEEKAKNARRLLKALDKICP
jgi:AAA family ATP:ADP antiporter